MVECLDSSVAAIPFSFSSSFDSLLSSRELEVYRLYFTLSRVLFSFECFLPVPVL